MIDLMAVRRHLRKASYDDPNAELLFREIADRLVEHLPLIRIQPNNILDCGAKAGYLFEPLRQLYPNAELLAIELDQRPLQKMQHLHCSRLVSDYDALACASQSIDLLISSLALHWTNDLGSCFREFLRVLKPNGLVMFAMLGVESLKELRDSFKTHREAYLHFPDMHDVGDLLVQNGFENPVMDMETVTLNYEKFETLLHDFKVTGTGNVHAKNPRGLLGKNSWKQSIQNYQNLSGNHDFPVTFEIVYGHAWKPLLQENEPYSEIVVPIDRVVSKEV